MKAKVKCIVTNTALLILRCAPERTQTMPCSGKSVVPPVGDQESPEPITNHLTLSASSYSPVCTQHSLHRLEIHYFDGVQEKNSESLEKNTAVFAAIWKDPDHGSIVSTMKGFCCNKQSFIVSHSACAMEQIK